jgi:hypothetical protein
MAMTTQNRENRIVGNMQLRRETENGKVWTSLYEDQFMWWFHEWQNLPRWRWYKRARAFGRWKFYLSLMTQQTQIEEEGGG